MIRITRDAEETNVDHLLGKAAEVAHAPRVIREECCVYVGERLVAVYLPNSIDTGPMMETLSTIQMQRMSRTGQFFWESRTSTFGATQRDYRKNRPCGFAALATQNPKAHALLCSLAAPLTAKYAEIAPEQHAVHAAASAPVKTDYVMPGGLFTSGVINENSVMPYHYDAGNTKGCFSAMWAARRNTTGGELVLPGYGVSLAIEDGSLAFFDGQAIVHGVAPIRRTAPNGVRYSVVYYTRERMWRCKTTSEELADVNAAATERNRKRAKTA